MNVERHASCVMIHDCHVRGQLVFVCTMFVQHARKGVRVFSRVFRPLASPRSYTRRRYGCTGESPSPPLRRQVPNPHHWKSKCGEDIDSPTSLRHHRESGDLQA
jgi:hypothetical protein